MKDPYNAEILDKYAGPDKMKKILISPSNYFLSLFVLTVRYVIYLVSLLWQLFPARNKIRV